jgi:hypothetical protein
VLKGKPRQNKILKLFKQRVIGGTGNSKLEVTWGLHSEKAKTAFIQ